MKGIYYPSCWGLLSGGKDSISTCQMLEDAGKLEGCVAIRTGIAVPEWEPWIIKLCEERKWRLDIIETSEKYDDLVVKYGFPGTSKHGWFMTYLKGRAIARFKQYHPGAILASGVRKYESTRRGIRTKPFSVWEGVTIAAPIYDWTTQQTWDYFYSRGFERAPAYSTLQISGDCLCGAMASEGEPDALRCHYPQIAEHFDALGESIKDTHPTRCKWGWSSNKKSKAKLTPSQAAICVECDRVDLFPETLETVPA